MRDSGIEFLKMKEKIIKSVGKYKGRVINRKFQWKIYKLIKKNYKERLS